MITTLKSQLKPTPVGKSWRHVKRTFRQAQEVRQWEKLGRPAPTPHLYKQKIVKQYAEKFSTDFFVETGTYQGDMVFAVKKIFAAIYSIELSDEYYSKAKARFSKFPNIHILHGDSAEVLPAILSHIESRCLFWLDGHYSSGSTAKGKLETPIREELNHIFGHQVKDHVILVDDARAFTGENDYPTIEELREIVMNQRPGWVVDVKDDIIRLHAHEKRQGVKNSKEI